MRASFGQLRKTADTEREDRREGESQGKDKWLAPIEDYRTADVRSYTYTVSS